MDYDDYRSQTSEAAEKTGAKEVSLAGGFYGLQFMADGAFIICALDLDEDSGWCCWLEDSDGEMLCQCTHDIGWCHVEELFIRAVKASIPHHCLQPLQF